MSNKYQIHDVTINIDDAYILKGDKKLKISFTEAKTLDLLCSRLNDIVTKEEIKNHAWAGRVVSDTSITKAISNLRNTFLLCGIHDEVIITVARVGYKCVAQASIICDEMLSPTVNNEEPVFPSKKYFLATKLKKTRSNIIKLRLWMLSLAGKYVLMAISFFFCAMSVYNVTHLSPLNFNLEFISPGYEKRTVVLNGKTTNVILRSSIKTPHEALSKITSLSPHSTIFFDYEKNKILMSYYDQYTGNTGSYMFSIHNLHNVTTLINKSIDEGRE